MLSAPSGLSWLDAGLWFAAIVLTGFAVSWLATDVGKMRQGPYIALLTVVTGALAGGYLAWTGTDPWITLLHNAGWGILAGVAVIMPVVRGLARLPATTPLARRRSATAWAWEGMVYGFAEGALLSALPALVVWQAADAAGWVTGRASQVAVGALALTGSVVVIVIHHLGYWDFRNRRMLTAVLACGLLTVAYLLTGSVLAPLLGHALLHVAAIVHGVALPPHERPGTAFPAEQARQAAPV
jgi:uncharacterized membrane protein